MSCLFDNIWCSTSLKCYCLYLYLLLISISSDLVTRDPNCKFNTTSPFDAKVSQFISRDSLIWTVFILMWCMLPDRDIMMFNESSLKAKKDENDFSVNRYLHTFIRHLSVCINHAHRRAHVLGRDTQDWYYLIVTHLIWHIYSSLNTLVGYSSCSGIEWLSYC